VTELGWMGFFLVVIVVFCKNLPKSRDFFFY
jgi:hypothetical protein